MEQRQCQHMKGKQVSRSSMVTWGLVASDYFDQYSCPVQFSFISFFLCVFIAAVIFPSLMQLHKGITDMDDKKQKAMCQDRYRRRDDDDRRQFSEFDAEREEECGICMELNSKIVLPNCCHCMCMKCYREWYAASNFLIDEFVLR